MKLFTKARRFAVLACAVLAAALPPLAQAADYTQVRQRAWEDMCMRGDQPMNFCTSYGGPAQLQLTAEREAALYAINAQINARYSFSSDNRLYGVNDYWTVPPGGFADCEDYVLAKIFELHQADFPVSAMRILIGQLADGQWHAILGVKTDRGMIHLDNLDGRRRGFKPLYYLDMNDVSSWRIASNR